MREVEVAHDDGLAAVGLRVALRQVRDLEVACSSLLTPPPRSLAHGAASGRGAFARATGAAARCSAVAPSPWSQQVLDDLVAHRLEARRRGSSPCGRAAAGSAPRPPGPSVAAGPGRQRDDAVGEQHRLVDVVGDQHDRLAGSRSQMRSISSCSVARVSASSAPSGSSSSSTSGSIASARATRHALPHAARELGRPLVARRRQVHQREVLLGVLALLVRAASRAKRWSTARCDVLVDGQPRQQRVVLEHDAAVGPGPASPACRRA